MTNQQTSDLWWGKDLQENVEGIRSRELSSVHLNSEESQWPQPLTHAIDFLSSTAHVSP